MHWAFQGLVRQEEIERRFAGARVSVLLGREMGFAGSTAASVSLQAFECHSGAVLVPGSDTGMKPNWCDWLIHPSAAAWISTARHGTGEAPEPVEQPRPAWRGRHVLEQSGRVQGIQQCSTQEQESQQISIPTVTASSQQQGLIGMDRLKTGMQGGRG